MTAQKGRSQIVSSSTVSNSELDDTELVKRLQESGKLERIRQDFTAKLVQCGWRDDMKDVAKDTVRESGGILEVTLDQIVAQVLPHGRETVPLALEEEIMQQIRQAVRQEQSRR